ncbi:NAD(P)-binding domain-containing protein [Rosistilla oblonga]|uniref:Putative oxidoreductase CzcO n=1 Tax=Rosistilla oblonga TaxID=2527990 RepID=A0A518IPC6_9BACT|nr:NAD(P)-binding domain-containing protein [Rosistilla oblonga]QDV54927.1 putative oxidoreductase CzcO [Rosistilla oblonga]
MSIDRDFCIIGAGPAGLQLAYYLEKAQRSYIVLEKGDSPGTFFKTFPRHRKLISINKVHTGHCDPEINYRWDWNGLLCDDDRFMFRNYSQKYFPHADDLVRYLKDFASLQNLSVQCNVDIQLVQRDAGGFRIRDTQGNEFSCRNLVIATGLSKAYVPEIPGIELVEQYDQVTMDAADFTNQRVLIIGKGNSGFETADHLVETTALIHVASPHPVKFAWQSHFVGNLRAINNNLLDTYLLKCQNATLEVEIGKIEKNGSKFLATVNYQRAMGSSEVIEYDRIICCTGFRMDRSIYSEDCKPEMTIHDRFPSLDSSWQSVNIPGLYFAGALTQSRDFKKTASAFIHGFRYNVRALASILLNRQYEEPIPSRPVAPSPFAMTEAVIQRVNRSSALWQQFSFLCDVLMVSHDGECVDYYEALPFDFVHDSLAGQYERYYTVSLEYGFGPDDDPFRSSRVAHTDADAAENSTFLHPVIRRFSNGTLLDEQHIVENLEANWTDEALHVTPLRNYFERTLPPRAAPAAMK